MDNAIKYRELEKVRGEELSPFFVSWMKNIKSVQISKPLNFISRISLQRVVLSQKPSFYILGKTKTPENNQIRNWVAPNKT